jgi:hypothetical protein
MGQTRRALVVGGGIAGMAAAIMLRRIGTSVKLIDLDPGWRVYGAGITITGPTLRAIKKLGIYEEVAAVAYVGHGIRVCDVTGRLVEEVATPKTEVPVEIQDNLINAIYGCHNGVIRMIPSYPSVVETSSNLAIIDIEGGKAALKILARSSREDMKEYIVNTLESVFNMAGMKVETSGSYGGWDPNPDSEILHLLLKEYKELFGKDGIIQVDHAGLECSIILGKYPHLDVVSMGPTMKSPHTTTERALIETVAPFWELLKKTLEDIPEK